VGDGSYLSPTLGLTSFGDVVATLNEQGHDLGYQEVPPDVFATFFPGAEETAQMMAYWQAHTYLGPDAEAKIELATKITTEQITDFATWASTNMPPDTE
jgi:hypothetical protein